MDVTAVNYGAYGARARATVRAAYAGEVVEADTGWYVLGRRPYHPVLRRFLAPDAQSPFDRGGINRYAYCGGDPVNRVDPSGTSFWKWFGVTLGVVGAVVATVATAGIAAAGIAAGFTPMLALATTASVASVMVDVASIGATLANKTELAGTLGYIGLALGVASMGAGMAGSIGRGIGKAAQMGRRATGNMRHALAGVTTPAATARRTAASATTGALGGARRASSGTLARSTANASARTGTGLTDTTMASARTSRRMPDAAGWRADLPTVRGGTGERIKSFARRFVRTGDTEDYGLARSQTAGEITTGLGTVAVDMDALGARGAPPPRPRPAVAYRRSADTPGELLVDPMEMFNIDLASSSQLP